MIVPNVDLRSELLSVRHQGRRQSCLSFASSAAHEHQVGSGEHLSVEYLYFHSVARTPGKNPNVGTTFAAAAAALFEEGQPVEAAWPYTPVAILPWIPPKITCPLHKGVMRPGKCNFEDVIAALGQGSPVILGLVITDAFLRPDGEGRVVFTTPDTDRGGHAVLAVGHGTSAAGEQMLLIRNSWGKSWGIEGYGWLPRPYIERQLHETALLT